MILLCIHGAPGVGKLSVGAELERITGNIFVHDHLVIETAAVVFPFGKNGFSELRSRLFEDLLDAACTTGRGIVLTHANDVFWKPSFETLLRGCVDRHRYDLRRVFLHCREEEHARRIADPRRAKYRKIRDIALLRRLTSAGEFNQPVIHSDDVVIDTTSLSPRKAAERVALSIASNDGLIKKVG